MINATTLSGNGIALSYSFPHGITGTPNVLVNAGSKDSFGFLYVDADATDIIVHYEVAPPAGTNNLKFYWEAI